MVGVGIVGQVVMMAHWGRAGHKVWLLLLWVVVAVALAVLWSKMGSLGNVRW